MTKQLINDDDELDKIIEKMGRKVRGGITISIATDTNFDTEPIEEWTKQQILDWHKREMERVIGPEIREDIANEKGLGFSQKQFGAMRLWNKQRKRMEEE